MKLQNHLPPEIYKFFDNLFLQDYEFLKEIREISEKFKLRENIHDPIYWGLLTKEEYDLLSLEDKTRYDEYHIVIREFFKKYCIPNSFRREMLDYIMTGRSQILTHSIIHFWYREIIIRIPFNFSWEKWKETWDVIKKVKKEKLQWKNYKLDENFTLKRKLYLESIWEKVIYTPTDLKTKSDLADSNKQKRIKEVEKYVKILNEFKKSNI